MSKECLNCGIINKNSDKLCLLCDFNLSNNYFDVLEIEATNDVSLIKKAYKCQVAKCHPDKVSHLSKDLVKLSNKKTKQLNKIYNVLLNSESREQYLKKISDTDEIIICSFCDAKNRIKKNYENKKPKCGKCGNLFIDEEEVHYNDSDERIEEELSYLGYDYCDVTNTYSTIGSLKDEDTLCFIAFEDQMGIRWKYNIMWFLVAIIIYYIIRINFFPDGASILWQIGIIIGSYWASSWILSLIFRKDAALKLIKMEMNKGNLEEVLDICELYHNQLEKDDKSRIIYSNILYIAAHFISDKSTQKHLFEKSLSLADTTTGVGDPKMKDTTLLFLADLYAKSTYVFKINLYNIEETNNIVQKYKMKISTEHAKEILDVSLSTWRN